jgi:hypothetical protein
MTPKRVRCWSSPTVPPEPGRSVRQVRPIARSSGDG